MVVEQAVFGSHELTCLICCFVLQRLELNITTNIPGYLPSGRPVIVSHGPALLVSMKFAIAVGSQNYKIDPVRPRHFEVAGVQNNQ